jgi:ribosomal protein S25
MKITAEEHRTLTARLAEILTVPTYDPATMTTRHDLAEQMNVTVEVAEGELKRLEKAGKIKKIDVRLPNGRKGKAYVEA